jgi:hypothetical protein
VPVARARAFADSKPKIHIFANPPQRRVGQSFTLPVGLHILPKSLRHARAMNIWAEIGQMDRRLGSMERGGKVGVASRCSDVGYDSWLNKNWESWNFRVQNLHLHGIYLQRTASATPVDILQRDINRAKNGVGR